MVWAHCGSLVREMAFRTPSMSHIRSFAASGIRSVVASMMASRCALQSLLSLVKLALTSQIAPDQATPQSLNVPVDGALVLFMMSWGCESRPEAEAAAEAAPAAP